MRYILTILVMACSFGLFAQSTLWTGSIDNDWNNPGNWNNGLPVPGGTANVTGTPLGGVFPVYEGDPLISYAINNFGQITFNGTVYLTANLTNFSGTQMTTNGILIIGGGVILDNDGDLMNNGIIENYGRLDNALVATITNNGSNTALNNYNFFLNNGTVNNTGMLYSNGTFRTTRALTNDGAIQNEGFFEVVFSVDFINNIGANIENIGNGEIFINGNLHNQGTVMNEAVFTLSSASLSTNEGSFTNNNRFQIAGTFENSGTTINNNFLKIFDGGTLDNSNVVDNNGTIDLDICGNLIQNSAQNIDATVLNDGKVYLLNGDVDVTNRDFGVIFTDINDTKPPVAGCRAGVVLELPETGDVTFDFSLVDKGSYASCGATVISRTVTPNSFGQDDVGGQIVTLRIEDNLGKVSTCDAVVQVIPFQAPITTIDNPDLNLECPEDITVSPPVGASVANVSWTNPAVTTTCATLSGPGGCTDSPLEYPGMTFIGEFDNSHYYRSGNPHNYDVAVSLVENFGGKLVEINSEAENQFVTQILNNQSHWIGINDFVIEGRFVYISSDLPITYSNWSNGEPNNHGDQEHVVEIYPNGLWNDLDQRAYRSVLMEVDCSIGVQEPTPCSPRIKDNLLVLYDFTEGMGNEVKDRSGTGAPIDLTIQDPSNTTWNPEVCGLTINQSTIIGSPNTATKIINACKATNAITIEAWVQAQDDDQSGPARIVTLSEKKDNLNFFLGQNNKDYVAQLRTTDTNKEGKPEAKTPQDEVNPYAIQHIVYTRQSNGKERIFIDGVEKFNDDRIGDFSSWDEDMQLTIGSEPNGDKDWLGTLYLIAVYNKALNPTEINQNLQAGFCCATTATYCPTALTDYTFLGEYEGHHYFQSNTETTWPVARANAVALGANLATVDNQAENDFIQNNITVHDVWIGYNDAEQEGFYLWESGFNSFFVNWRDGEPNNSGGDEDYTRLLQNTGEWTDRNESYLSNAILEFQCGDNPSNTAALGDTVTLEVLQGRANGGLYTIGTSEVFIRATDACGNEEICMFNITVEENPATVTIDFCPPDLTVETAPGEPGGVFTWQEPVASTDCFRGGPVTAIQSLGPKNGEDLAPIGTSRILYALIDSCGTFASCEFNLTVVEVPATLETTCSEDIIITLPPGITSTHVIWDEPTASSDCYKNTGGRVTQLAGPDNGASLEVNSTTTILYLLSDDCGNTELCAFDITILGTEGITLDCPSDLTVNTEPGALTAPVSWMDPILLTSCSSGGLMLEQIEGLPNGSNFPAGVSTITYTAADACGNTTSCSFTVTVNAVNAELNLECPQSITVSTLPGATSTIVNWNEPSVTSTCINGGVNLSLQSPLASGALFPIGINTVTYVAADACGNTASCSFTVTVNAVNAELNLECPQSITVSTLPGATSTIVNWNEPSVTSTCINGGVNLSLQSPLASGALFPIGINTVTYVAADACGNTASCSFDVTVNAVNAELNLECPQSITVSTLPGATSTIVNWNEPSVTSTCINGGVNLSLQSPLASGALFPIGINTVTYVAADACGNTTSCSFDVTVNAVNAELNLECPQSINVSTLPGATSTIVNWNEPSVTSTCINGGVNLSLQSPLANGALFPIGINTVTYVAADACGNTTSCSFDVTVNAVNAELNLKCPQSITVSTLPGATSTIVNWNEPSVTSTCINGGVNLSLQSPLASGALFPIGINTVTYVAADACGNTTSCSFDVTVNAVNAELNLECPQSINVSTLPGATSTIVNWNEPSVTSTCINGGVNLSLQSPLASGALFPIGVTTVTYVAADACGNTASCSFDVTVNAVNAELSLECPQNITLDAQPGTTATVVSWDEPSLTTNCVNGGASLSLQSSLASGDLFPIGISTVTYVAADACGNTASCSFTVTVNDTTKPLLCKISKTDVSTFGGNDGSTIASATGGVPPYAFEWDNGSVTASLTDLVAGDYSVTITDDQGSICEATITINQPSPDLLSCSVTKTDVTINGGSDGTASLSFTGGIPPFTFQWSNGATTASISGLTAGTYLGTVIGANGNTCSVSVIILEPTGGICDDFLVVAEITDEDCLGDQDGAITLTANCVHSGGGIGGPVINLAEGKNATQSSVENKAVASRAVDGNTSGIWYLDYSVSSTRWSKEPWWQVDLGAVSSIQDIEVYGRTDCCSEWLSDYYVFISDKPFASNEVSSLLSDPEVTSLFQSGQGANPDVFNTDMTGRYVRIQLSGIHLLQLAEVIVKGQAGGGDPCTYSYNWSDPDIGNIPNPTGLKPGIYTVTVADGNGCTTILDATVQAGEPCVDCTNFTVFEKIKSPSCKTCTDGTIALTPNCGNDTGGNNLAFGKRTRQSSTNWKAGPDRAVDGNTDGNFFGSNSVTGTRWEFNPFWEVDLGSNLPINEVKLWNRTDCCQSFLSNFYIIVSDDPIPYDFTAAINLPGATLKYFPGSVGDIQSFAFATTGRYVRVQLADQGILSLTEVEIFGPSNDSACDHVTYQWSTGATSSSISNLSPGLYSVTITNEDGCEIVKTYKLGAVPFQGTQGRSKQMGSVSTEKQLTIMPNPASHYTVLDLIDFVQTDVELTLFNALGQKVQQVSLQKGFEPSYRLELNMLPAGTYYVVLSDKEQFRQSLKLMIVKY